MDESPNSITAPQYKFLCDLVSSKELSSLSEREIAFLTGDKERFLRMSKQQAHNAIQKLVELGKKAQVATPPQPSQIEVTPDLTEADILPNPAPQPLKTTLVSKGEPSQVKNDPNVPDAGYYFIVDPTSEPAGKESFFRVSKPDENSRWHGYTFLAIQASDDFYSIKDKQRRDAIYAEILKDPINAMNEYGIRLGRCGVCNRTLTDRDSRLRGIGPICAARLDSTPTQEDIDLLTMLGMIDPDGE